MNKLEGIYTSIDDLLGLRFAARQLTLGKSRRAYARMSGDHSSKIRGRGIDFDEVRMYQSGDDIRNMDWRVTARTGSPHIKLYHEEKERPVFIICDQRSSLFFGSQTQFKSSLATKMASLLAWLSIEQGDKLGGMVFNDSQHTEIKPKRGKTSVLRYINTLAEYNQALSTALVTTDFTLADAINNSYRIIKPGTKVYLISDFYSFNDECLEGLSLLHRHNDIACVYIFDRLEKELPPANFYSFLSSGGRFNLHTGSKKLQADYSRAFGKRKLELKNKLDKFKIPLFDVQTNENPVNSLITILNRQYG